MKESLGETLARWRHQAKLTQKEVADALGYSTAQFISNWERDVSTPPDDALPILAKLFKVRVARIAEVIADAKIREIEAWKREVGRAS